MRMLRNILHNFVSKPATRTAPEPRELTPHIRGSVEFTNDACTYCGACAIKCPANAIEVDRTAKTLTFDMFRCVDCACCSETCKKGCIQMKEAFLHASSQKPIVQFQGAPILQNQEE